MMDHHITSPNLQASTSVSVEPSEASSSLNDAQVTSKNTGVRCKSRKQKCDVLPGEETCRNCIKAGTVCNFFDQPQRSIQSTVYVENLEEQVKQLRAELAAVRATSQSMSSDNSQHPIVMQNTWPPTYHQDFPPPQSAIMTSPMSGPSLTLQSPSLPAASNMPESARREHVTTHSPVSEEDSSSSGQDAARGVAYLSLNAASEAHFLGASSGAFWASMILAQLNQQTTGFEVPSIFEKFQDTRPLLPDSVIDNVSPETSTILFNACYNHIQMRYPFLDWPTIRDHFQGKEDIIRAAAMPNARRETRTAAFFIWLVIALGARLCRHLSLGLALPDDYFAKAMVHLHIIVTLHDLVNVQALLLMTMYSLRSNGPNTYYLVSIAMRLSISMGLHRKLTTSKARSLTPYTIELRKRIWWSCYSLDRWQALALGRPLGIADHDIDVELPANVDALDLSCTPCGPRAITSMTSALTLIKIRQIEGEIQSSVYRASSQLSTSDGTADLECLSILQKIDEWEQNLPQFPARAPSPATVPHGTHEWFLLRADEARLYLLRPLISGPLCDDNRIRMAAKTSASACQLHKKLVQASSSNFSLSALHQVFLTGLTLLYAVRRNPRCLTVRELDTAVRAASNCLFAYSQQYAAAVVFYNAFEDLSSACIDLVMRPDEVSPSTMPIHLNNTEWPSQLAAASSAIHADMHQEVESLLHSFGVLEQFQSPVLTSDLLLPSADPFTSHFGGWSFNQTSDLEYPFSFASTYR